MTTRYSKAAKWLIAIGAIVLLIGLAFGIRAWLTRTRDVPAKVLSKVNETMRNVFDDSISIDLYNGSDWTIEEVTVELKAGKVTRRYKEEVFLEPLKSGLAFIEIDARFLRVWRTGGMGMAALLGERPPKTRQWRLVSATGRPGG